MSLLDGVLSAFEKKTLLYVVSWLNNLFFLSDSEPPVCGNTDTTCPSFDQSEEGVNLLAGVHIPNARRDFPCIHCKENSIKHLKVTLRLTQNKSTLLIQRSSSSVNVDTSN